MASVPAPFPTPDILARPASTSGIHHAEVTATMVLMRKLWPPACVTGILVVSAGNQTSIQDTPAAAHASNVLERRMGDLPTDILSVKMPIRARDVLPWRTRPFRNYDAHPHGGVESWITQDVLPHPATTQRILP